MNFIKNLCELKRKNLLYFKDYDEKIKLIITIFYLNTDSTNTLSAFT